MFCTKAFFPIAVLLLAVVLFANALSPKAVFCPPVVFAPIEKAPTDAFSVPVVFASKQLYPIAVLLCAVVFKSKAPLPTAVFLAPVVLPSIAPAPTAVLSLAVVFCDKALIPTATLFPPDVFASNRSTESYEKYGGYLPIYEKENAFEFIDDYDQIAIVDADIYIRPDARNIFEEMAHSPVAFGAVAEREMDLQSWYQNKIINYSRMQYGTLHSNQLDFKPNELGFEFFNMGLMVINCAQFSGYLKGQTPKQFIQRMEFKDFVDGQGAWKWSTERFWFGLRFYRKTYS